MTTPSQHPLPEHVDQTLDRLGKETLGIRPRNDFVDRVMVAIESKPMLPTFAQNLLRSGTRMMWLAAISAIVAGGLAFQTLQSTNQDIAASSVNTMELEW